METLAYIHAAEAYEVVTGKSTHALPQRQPSQPVSPDCLETCIAY